MLQFELSKSLDAAATDVQSAINQAAGKLPVDLPSPPTFSKTNPNDQPIIYIGLTSDTVTEGQLYDYANTQVGERISILPGVSQIASVRGAIGCAHQGRSFGDGQPQYHHRRPEHCSQERNRLHGSRAVRWRASELFCCSRKVN